MKTTFTLLALSAALIALPALANENDPEHMRMKAQTYLTKMDTDGNGSVSKAEHDAFASRMFTEADTNGDGSLSLDELAAHKAKEKADMKSDMKAGGGAAPTGMGGNGGGAARDTGKNNAETGGAHNDDAARDR